MHITQYCHFHEALILKRAGWRYIAYDSALPRGSARYLMQSPEID